MLTTRRARTLLDVFVGLQLALTFISGVIVFAQHQVTDALLGLAGTAIVLLAWVLYRRKLFRWAPLVLLVGATLTGFSDTGMVSALFTLLALALIVLEHGKRAGTVAGGAVVLWLALFVWLFTSELKSVLLQSLGNAMLVTLGLMVGLMLRQVRADQRENRRLLNELRATTDTEKELMLADERARSARELHDGLGHRLTLISMSLEYARRVRSRDDEQAWSEVENAQVEARDALAYMRRWVRALNPPREPNLVGIAALDAIAESFRGTGLSVQVAQSGEEVELGKDASLFAYRLVQEGLTNVLRHSMADEVSIAVRWRGDWVELELRDNGGGAPESPPAQSPSASETAGGFGLRSLSERARELGGSFIVQHDEEGVVLVGSIPVGSAG